MPEGSILPMLIEKQEWKDKELEAELSNALKALDALEQPGESKERKKRM